MRSNSEWRIKINIEPHHNNNTQIIIITSGTRSGSGWSAKKYFIFSFLLLLYWLQFLPSSGFIAVISILLLLVADDDRTCTTNFCASLSNKIICSASAYISCYTNNKTSSEIKYLPCSILRVSWRINRVIKKSRIQIRLNEIEITLNIYFWKVK